jgi:hypothetical protein
MNDQFPKQKQHQGTQFKSLQRNLNPTVASHHLRSNSGDLRLPDLQNIKIKNL